MQRLFTADLLDIFPTDLGFIYACEETLDDKRRAAAFYSYNQQVDVFEKIPVVTYIFKKFGENGEDIARALGNFITCKAVPLSLSSMAAAFPDGTLKILGIYGETIDSAKVQYLDLPACSPALNGLDLWYAVPEANAIINYSVKHKRIEFRIGSPKDKTFCHPTDISIYDNKLFVCNSNSYKIKTIDLNTYHVADHAIFKEPVTKYFRTGNIEYAVLRSGVYSLD